VRGLGLKSEAKWRAYYYRSSKKPDEISGYSRFEYAQAGWAEWAIGVGANFEVQDFKVSGLDVSVRRAVLVQSTGEGDAARTLSRDGAARQAGRYDRGGSRKVLSRRSHSRDCGVLRERCAQHVPGLAPTRTVSRTAVAARVWLKEL
jgi:hypothetical protein